jgi:hypothetical protein
VARCAKAGSELGKELFGIENGAVADVWLFVRAYSRLFFAESESIVQLT